MWRGRTCPALMFESYTDVFAFICVRKDAMFEGYETDIENNHLLAATSDQTRPKLVLPDFSSLKDYEAKARTLCRALVPAVCSCVTRGLCVWCV